MAKGCTTNNYEDARKQGLVENQPCLPKLSSKTDGVVEPRRSSRARNPVSSYREDVSIDLPSLGKRSRSRPSSWESYVVRPLDEIKVATEGERIRALEAAEALLMNLKTSHPSFVKSMVRSHVYSCFWLGLPSKFCEEHLPKTLNDMILEDENGSKYEAVYIGKRSGLSGGWRAFALDHKLDDGDALVFELIEAAKFKVYIVRAFPNSVEKEDTLEEEGTMRGIKAARNGESESKKSKNPTQAIVHEHKEPVNQKTFKEEGKTPATKATKRRKAASNSESESNKEKKPRAATKLPVTAESKGVAQLETVKPKAATKLSNKTRNYKEDIAREIGDSGITEHLLEINALKLRETNLSKKEELVQDADGGLKKGEPVEGASKKPRKKPAPKLFRKKV